MVGTYCNYCTFNLCQKNHKNIEQNIVYDNNMNSCMYPTYYIVYMTEWWYVQVRSYDISRSRIVYLKVGHAMDVPVDIYCDLLNFNVITEVINVNEIKSDRLAPIIFHQNWVTVNGAFCGALPLLCLQYITRRVKIVRFWIVSFSVYPLNLTRFGWM